MISSCNYVEVLRPQDNLVNVFVFCWDDYIINQTFYIIDENGNIITTDIPENWVYYN